MTKSSTKKIETKAIVETETLDKKELRKEAKALKIDSDRVLDYLEDDDLEGLSKLIEKTKQIAAEQEQIDDLIRTSKLDKKSLHMMGVCLHGCTDEGFLFFDETDQGWLRNLLFQIFSPEFKEFLNSDKTLKNVEKFVRYLESKKTKKK